MILNRHLSERTKIMRAILALACLASLAGCISSNEPILTDSQPLLGNQLHLQFYTLRDGAAHEPGAETFRWHGGRYMPAGGTQKDLGPFTLHAFDGGDLLVQSIRPGKPVEYAIARKLADGAYLLFAIDAVDADAATRTKYCEKDLRADCRVATSEAVLAFARASAAKSHSTGGLAILTGP
jgi:hypothetical protein